jgi:hypothetical protein
MCDRGEQPRGLLDFLILVPRTNRRSVSIHREELATDMIAAWVLIRDLAVKGIAITRRSVAK